jgi:hypothetical protein
MTLTYIRGIGPRRCVRISTAIGYEEAGTDSGDVDENNDFPSLCNCGRRFLCLGKRD